MSTQSIRRERKLKPEKAEVNVERPTLLHEQASDDVVESFSQGFEEELRRILGRRYQERPKRRA